MLNDLRRFSSSAFPEELRQSAWDEVFQRVRLASSLAGHAAAPAGGHVALCSSALDSVFLQVSASPQVLSPHPDNARLCQGSTVLVLALLSGSGALVEGGQRVAIGAGDIVLFDPAQAWRIELDSDFRALLVKLESASFILRLVRTGSQELNRIATRNGVGAVCLSLIQSIADELAHLERDQLPPLEATLTELLVACLSHRERGQAEDSTSVQLAHLRRVCRSIEARLGDAELQVEDVARLEGLSVRYLQKLFKTGATTFGEYLRNRRLERCRLDLANPALAHF
ncbi:hypothetical protein, partial [Pseudomonas sp.]|uniref:AraC-like ligand-binding domain-containing protein n=1 Tax=Pseudomonas sp. TaxID=306 RepID=UPI0028A9F166